MNIRIIVAAHKPYWMPADGMYLPLQVGAEGKPSIGFTPDNTGEQISGKNPNYCELTGLYWAWKNLEADYVGLAHYRRHFSNGRRTGPKEERVIRQSELEPLLAGQEVLLPKPRNYWIETNYSQYAHAHHAADLDTTREILSERYPEYLKAFDESMKRTRGHRFNMLIMTKPKLDAYCEWLFDVLFELEKRLDISGYSANDQRVFGFVSERLLDVWIETNGLSYRELPYVFMESQNWWKKGTAFLYRRISGHPAEQP